MNKNRHLMDKSKPMGFVEWLEKSSTIDRVEFFTVGNPFLVDLENFDKSVKAIENLFEIYLKDDTIIKSEAIKLIEKYPKYRNLLLLKDELDYGSIPCRSQFRDDHLLGNRECSILMYYGTYNGYDYERLTISTTYKRSTGYVKTDHLFTLDNTKTKIDGEEISTIDQIYNCLLKDDLDNIPFTLNRFYDLDRSGNPITDEESIYSIILNRIYHHMYTIYVVNNLDRGGFYDNIFKYIEMKRKYDPNAFITDRIIDNQLDIDFNRFVKDFYDFFIDKDFVSLTIREENKYYTITCDNDEIRDNESCLINLNSDTEYDEKTKSTITDLIKTFFNYIAK